MDWEGRADDADFGFVGGGFLGGAGVGVEVEERGGDKEDGGDCRELDKR